MFCAFGSGELQSWTTIPKMDDVEDNKKEEITWLPVVFHDKINSLWEIPKKNWRDFYDLMIRSDFAFENKKVYSLIFKFIIQFLIFFFYFPENRLGIKYNKGYKN